MLPSGAEFFSYSVNENLIIKAWMPDGYSKINQHNSMSCDDFYNEFCEECERNCYTYLKDFMDDDNEIDWTEIPGGESEHCYVYEEGYSGQYCPRGFVMEDTKIDFKIPNMVFQIGLNYKTGLFGVESDSARLRAGVIINDQVYATNSYQASNVFGDSTVIDNICWGGNNAPNTLKGIVETYFNSPFNNDLLPITKFEENCRNLLADVNVGNFSLSKDNFICYGTQADALILVHAEENKDAFFTLLSAGFKPLESLQCVIAIPILKTVVEKELALYSGYITLPDSVGKSWFLTEDGLLVGQV